MNKEKYALIDKLYDPETFKLLGLELVAMLADYLERSKSNKIPVNNYLLPHEALDGWKDFMNSKGSLIDFFQKILDTSIHTHNPNYMGHQVSPPAPIAAFGGLFSDLLNNGMAVYEMGAASNPLEKIATDMLCKTAGYDDNAAGFLTSGGTLANVTALLTARSVIVEDDVWENGSKNRMGIMVSEQAHYCIDRAARIMGLGSEGIIRLPVNDKFQVDVEQLNEKYQEAKDKGVQIFAIVASSCSTSTGSYDNIEAFAKFAHEKGIWLHVDGAHGGAAIMSKKYSSLVDGINNAHSIIIDCHKMMMTPTICTAVLYKNKMHSKMTFRQKAEYLFDESESFDWYNSGKRTFECTKLMMSIKFMAIIRHIGIGVFEAFIDILYDNARLFSSIIREDKDFELALEPEANIICFRLKSENSDTVNAHIRQRILEDGRFYIVQTRIKGSVYLRTSIMNPYTSAIHFKALLKEIKEISMEI